MMQTEAGRPLREMVKLVAMPWIQENLPSLAARIDMSLVDKINASRVALHERSAMYRTLEFESELLRLLGSDGPDPKVLEDLMDRLNTIFLPGERATFAGRTSPHLFLLRLSFLVHSDDLLTTLDWPRMTELKVNLVPTLEFLNSLFGIRVEEEV